MRKDASVFKILQGAGSFKKFKQNQGSSWVVLHEYMFTAGQRGMEARFSTLYAVGPKLMY